MVRTYAFLGVVVFVWLFWVGAFDRSYRLVQRDRHFDAGSAPQTFEKEFETFSNLHPEWRDNPAFLIWKDLKNSDRFQDIAHL